MSIKMAVKSEVMARVKSGSSYTYDWVGNRTDLQTPYNAVDQLETSANHHYHYDPTRRYLDTGFCCARTP
jgi:hypothetical protein